MLSLFTISVALAGLVGKMLLLGKTKACGFSTLNLSLVKFIIYASKRFFQPRNVPDFFKLSTYLVFFCVIIAFYGLPLNIVRDVYVTARSFITRLKALRRYQTATRNMDQRYPNATEEELVAMNDRTCIICREEMVSPAAQEPNGRLDGPNTTPKKLPCGHIFHFHCLRSWLERQQNCPTW
jgi:hypothetical protein